MWLLTLEITTPVLLLVIIAMQAIVIVRVIALSRKYDESKETTSAFTKLVTQLEDERRALAEKDSVLSVYEEKLKQIASEKEYQQKLIGEILSISRAGTPVFLEQGADQGTNNE